jgi:hypothetical protein
MLPASYATSAAVVLALGGLLACFAGYRLFRVVLAIAGFVLGAFVVTSFMGTSSMWVLTVAAVVGGLAGAIVLVAAYFMGVGLVGAGLAAFLLNLGWRFVGGEPPTWLLVVVCVVAALAALSVVRWVVVFGTAIAGAWTLIIAASALMGDEVARRAATEGDVWILYPIGPTSAAMWQVGLWFGLAVAGVAVQLATTNKSGTRKRVKAK